MWAEEVNTVYTGYVLPEEVGTQSQKVNNDVIFIKILAKSSSLKLMAAL